MNVPVVSHLKLLVNLYNKMNNRFLVLLVIYLIIYLLSVLYKNKQIFCAILLSLLSWERGLKFMDIGCHTGKCRHVAPLVGAWIEIGTETDAFKRSRVAPLVGAWIEMRTIAAGSEAIKVAPLVGAWIEIHLTGLILNPSSSLLSWERGLKWTLGDGLCYGTAVAPLVGAWIEISVSMSMSQPHESLLSWERGLKYIWR